MRRHPFGRSSPTRSSSISHRFTATRAAPTATLEAIRRLAIALAVTADELVFEEGERGPDDELRLQFEAISRFDPDEKKTAKEFSTVSFSSTKPKMGFVRLTD